MRRSSLPPPAPSRPCKPTGPDCSAIVRGKSSESIPFFERAVELDPQFCSAYIMLGSSYHGVGDEQTSRKNFATAFQLKDKRLTQEENFLATATYYWNITGNLEKENAVLTLYQQVYPRSFNAANLLGINYVVDGEAEEALQEFNWTSNIPRNPPLSSTPIRAQRSCPSAGMTRPRR